MTHDYTRHGTTTLFPALDILAGKVIGSCLPQHRHQEFLKFLRTVEREVPKGLDATNTDPTPFIWTATAESILAKFARGRIALETSAETETDH